MHFIRNLPAALRREAQSLNSRTSKDPQPPHLSPSLLLTHQLLDWPFSEHVGQAAGLWPEGFVLGVGLGLLVGDGGELSGSGKECGKYICLSV